MHSQKPGFLHFFNNSKSKQNKNNPKQVFVDTFQLEMHAKFQQKKYYMALGALGYLVSQKYWSFVQIQVSDFALISIIKL